MSISMPTPTMMRKLQKTMAAGGRSFFGKASRPISGVSRLWVRISEPSSGISTA